MIELIDKYQLVNHIGDGHFAKVFLCRDRQLNEDIAVKVIEATNAEQSATAIREAQLMKVCHHKHTVEVKAVRDITWRGHAVVIIVMEYLANGSVQSHIDTRFLSIAECSRIIQEALLGLEHAHNNDVIHRDIKPANIMIGNHGESKLSDFGFALDAAIDFSDRQGYRPHQPMEVVNGQPMDKLSDIYAMGMTYYRLINNLQDLSFPFNSSDEWKAAMRKETYPPKTGSPHIPAQVTRVVKKAIHRDVAKRYSSCSQFRQALEKLHFFIPWTKVNNDQWEGQHQQDYYTLNRFHKRTGWVVEFRKNGIKKSEYSASQVPDSLIDKVFFDIIITTTLKQ